MSGPAWLVALDASTPRAVIAVGWVDVTAGTHALVVADDDDEGPDPASAGLMPRVERALLRAGIEARALAAVACGRGPGTFTGTRVAVASAKGLAYGVGCPVIPVSTLAAVAASDGRVGTVLATLDARRGEVYAGRWRCEVEGSGLPRVEALDEERVATLAVVLGELASGPASGPGSGLGDPWLVGSGVQAYPEAIPEHLARSARPLPGPTAAGLWAAGVAAWVDGRAQHPAALEAVYLRASYAELGLNTPKRPFVKSPFV